MLWIVLLAVFGVSEAVPANLCGQTFEVLAGQTRTVNYLFDTNYPGNQNCVFHLRGTGADRLQISFTAFDVEKHAKCNFDYLQIYDGPSTSSQPLNKLCGYDIPSPIEAHGNVATLKFVSDRTLNKAGFVLQFTTHSSEQFLGKCLPTMTKSSGSFQSPLYPNNYPNRVNCTYEIAPATGNQILIQFLTFQIERSSYCVMDYVTIKARTGEEIGPKLCGDLGGNSYLVPGSHAIINFVSDRSSTRRGFDLLYKVVSTCKDLDDVCSDGCRVGVDGMVECTCKSGFSSPKGESQCYDVDECKTNNGGCQERCKNTDGSYECECTRDGYFLAPDKRNCTDRTCNVENAGCEHNCHLFSNGGYYCTCNNGFQVAADGHNCTDIDECNSNKYQHGCEQTCINEPGSYYCDCQDGYMLSANSRTCEDVNECPTLGENCDQTCDNYPGGWTCSCYQGYQVNPDDPNGCMDIDECIPSMLPAHCDECINFDGGFSCTQCADGFKLNENETLCLDVNECAENNGGCQQICINSPGSSICTCYPGQKLVEGQEKSGVCEDINECASNEQRGPCEHYCENSVGSFRCHCLDGYEILAGSGTSCQDIDECAASNGGCEQQCNNTIGSFACSCFEGYWMIDNACTDVDECIEDKPCDIQLGAKCINNVGSFQCVCPPGYSVVNTTICQDVDECANGTYGPTHGCQQRCVNTPGSFMCDCHIGFVDVGNDSCADINECSQSLCEHNELCQNTIGSFQCSCRAGYFLLDDNLHCSDVDECASNAVRCQQECLNEIGHYKCGCRPGYELQPDNYTCNDINECQRNTSGCSDGCVNTEGGFRCYCYQGYQLKQNSNDTCEDIDECATNKGGCHHVCENSIGSFSCSCRAGYQADTDSRCHDINECATDNGGCGQDCHNFNGTYNCTCKPDFKLGEDARSCGHCPSCEAFEQVQADVESLKPLVAQVRELTSENMRLSAKISWLTDNMRMITTLTRKGSRSSRWPGSQRLPELSFRDHE